MADDAVAARDRNRDSWNADRYASWVEALGTPQEEAARLLADPAHKIRRFGRHMGDVRGKRICNVQGSHARVAVALALLGAEASVLDFAEENRRYGLELAAAAGVTIDYRLGDVIEAGSLGLDGSFEWLVMELGILHYHLDLDRFFQVMTALLAPGGRLLLHEFHPALRALQGPAGDYFNTEAVTGDVPDPTGKGRALGACVLRFWNLGEVVTAAIKAGLRIEALEELPHWDHPMWPGIYTLVAAKAA